MNKVAILTGVFLIGVFIGIIIGISVISLCQAAKCRDIDRKEANL